ncbi:MAG: hypothetical protein ABI268_09900 [Rhodanobacter sp.]
MTVKKRESVTLPQSLVLAICLGAVGWLFVTVSDMHGDHNAVATMQARISSLETAARNCSHGGS